MKKILFFIFILFSFIGCEKEPEIYTGSKSDGRLSGVFSVSSNKKVYFSQGNLCAKYAGGVDNPYFLYCFFFANQWETLYYFENAVIKTPYPNNCIEIECTPYDVTYIYEHVIEEANRSGWNGTSSSTEFYHRIRDLSPYCYTDMFPWGIVGDDLAVARGYSSVKAGDVFTALSLNLINADWGNLRILNGGNTPGWWRTLSIYEWEYLMFERENAESLMGLGMIIEVDDCWGSAIGVCGLILLPDNSIVKLNSSGKRFSDNVFTFEEWREIEAKGAVFLTAASSLGGGNFPSDQRKGGIVSAEGDMFYEDEESYSWDVGYTSGYYWSSTSVSDEYSYETNRLDAHCVLFKELVGYKSSSADKINNWMPIRLVQDVE